MTRPGYYVRSADRDVTILAGTRAELRAIMRELDDMWLRIHRIPDDGRIGVRLPAAPEPPATM